MATFQKCDTSVTELATALLREFNTHSPVLLADVKIDLLFAFPEYDDKTGEPKGDALKKNGVKVLGITRKLPLKDRVMGRGDAEVILDGDWWAAAGKKAQRALLDHELHHIAVKTDKRGLCTDDIGRPIIQLRPHDAEFGWFAIVAQRHGGNSMEAAQARWLHDKFGQAFWPDLMLIPNTESATTKKSEAA